MNLLSLRDWCLTLSMSIRLSAVLLLWISLLSEFGRFSWMGTGVVFVFSLLISVLKSFRLYRISSKLTVGISIGVEGITMSS